MRTPSSIVIVAAALLTACGTGEPESTGNPLPTGAYQAVEVSGDTPPDLDTARLTLTLTPDALSAGTGCNTITARARLDADRLTVSDTATTDLPCPAELVAVQQWLTSFLENRPRVTADGEALTLTTAETTIRLRSTGSVPPASGQPPTAPRTA